MDTPSSPSPVYRCINKAAILLLYGESPALRASERRAGLCFALPLYPIVCAAAQKEAVFFMSDTAIMTLKTMLANLDDAKKYQSLRDVMETTARPRPGRRV